MVNVIEITEKIKMCIKKHQNMVLILKTGIVHINGRDKTAWITINCYGIQCCIDLDFIGCTTNKIELFGKNYNSNFMDISEDEILEIQENTKF